MTPFGPWEPDKGPFAAEVVVDVVNALPVSNGWAPLPDLAPVSASLGAESKGAWYVRTMDGAFKMIAGTAAKLLAFNATTSGWDDISGTTYAVPEGDMWQAAPFGSLLIVTNIVDGPQKLDVEGAGPFEPLGGSPPKAKFVCVAGDFLVLGFLRDGTDDAPLDLQWSGLNDAEFWTVGKKASDRQRLPDGEDITGLFAVRGGARIMQRKARRALTFTGGQFVFSVQLVDGFKGALASNAIVPISLDDYVYLAEDGFYRGDGNTPIGGERIDRWFLADIDPDHKERVQGIADPFNKVVLWCYRRNNGKSGLLGYHWQLDRWFRSTLEVSTLTAFATPALTLEDLDAFGTLDTLPASLDDARWKGGRPKLGAFLPDNRLAVFTGETALAEFETPYSELNPGGRAFVNGATVIGDAPVYFASVSGADYHGTTEIFSNPVAASARTGVVPLRKNSRLHRFRLLIEAETPWTHVHGIRPNAKPAGRV